MTGQLLPKEHYTTKEYDHLGKWMLYYEQIQTVMQLPDVQNVLVVGVGTGVVVDYLRRSGYVVDTLDNDARLLPTYVGDVRTKKISKKYDVVLCCHVLEHLPWKDVATALGMMRNYADILLVSVPHIRYFIEGYQHFHGHYWAWSIKIPVNFLEHHFDGIHYWELGKKGYTAQAFKNYAKNQGWEFVKEWYPPVNAWSHYFLCKVKK